MVWLLWRLILWSHVGLTASWFPARRGHRRLRQAVGHAADGETTGCDRIRAGRTHARAPHNSAQDAAGPGADDGAHRRRPPLRHHLPAAALPRRGVNCAVHPLEFSNTASVQHSERAPLCAVKPLSLRQQAGQLRLLLASAIYRVHARITSLSLARVSAGCTGASCSAADDAPLSLCRRAAAGVGQRALLIPRKVPAAGSESYLVRWMTLFRFLQDRGCWCL